MSYHEIAINQDRYLDGALLRKALTVVCVILAISFSNIINYNSDQVPQDPIIQKQVKPQPNVEPLTRVVLSNYDVEPSLAKQIALTAKKYERSNFPRAEDILAIIGIESAFDPTSVSGLGEDPARGLMQIRPKVWKIAPAALATIDQQIRIGASILHSYYRQLHTPAAAVEAYNIGISNYVNQEHLHPEYVEKYNEERSLYKM